MPTRCSGCKNTYGVEGVSFHFFPKCDKMRRRWAAAMKRANWTPTKSSRLCSAHFSPDSFEYNPLLAKSLNVERVSKVLKPDAVPTVFDFKTKPSAPRTAYAKCRRLEIVSEALREDASSERRSSISSDSAVPSFDAGCMEGELYNLRDACPFSQELEPSAPCCPRCGNVASTVASKYIQANMTKDTKNRYVLTAPLLRTFGTQTEPSPLDDPGTPWCSTPCSVTGSDSEGDMEEEEGDDDTSYQAADNTLGANP